MKQKKRFRLAIVQPILSPMKRPVFNKISARTDIEFKVFLLTDKLGHRQGWDIDKNELFAVEVVGAIKQTINSRLFGKKTGFGMRVIPLGLVRSILRFKPDTVVCSNITEFLFLLPAKFIAGMSIGVILEETPHTSSQRSVLKQWVRSKLYRLMDYYIASGEETIKYLKQIGVSDKSIYKAWYSVDNKKYSQSKSQVKQTKKKQWITVGRMISAKGIKELLLAWGKQDKQFMQNNELFIVGDGPQYQEFLDLITSMSFSNVQMLGFKTPEALEEIYPAMDVFIFPTLIDTWGLVVNEAMAAGLPIICSCYAGCYSDLVSEKNGIIIDPLDISDIADKITLFEAKSSEWPEMGRISEQIIAEYTIDKSADAICHAAFEYK